MIYTYLHRWYIVHAYIYIIKWGVYWVQKMNVEGIASPTSTHCNYYMHIDDEHVLHAFWILLWCCDGIEDLHLAHIVILICNSKGVVISKLVDWECHPLSTHYTTIARPFFKQDSHNWLEFLKDVRVFWVSSTRGGIQHKKMFAYHATIYKLSFMSTTPSNFICHIFFCITLDLIFKIF